MDLICLILGIIDFFKPSIGLSIAAITLSICELILLLHYDEPFGVSYLFAIGCIVLATYTICVL